MYFSGVHDLPHYRIEYQRVNALPEDKVWLKELRSIKMIYETNVTLIGGNMKFLVWIVFYWFYSRGTLAM